MEVKKAQEVIRKSIIRQMPKITKEKNQTVRKDLRLQLRNQIKGDQVYNQANIKIVHNLSQNNKREIGIIIIIKTLKTLIIRMI